MNTKPDKIIALVESVTKKWAKQKKAEERHAAAVLNRRYAMTGGSDRTTLKDAAWKVMKEAYLKVSGPRGLPALARQIMYAARGHIQEITGEPLRDKYFTQTLLPDYIEANPDQCADWNVVFDARGHFHEPHTGHEVPLGTIEIREYLQGVADHVVEDPKFDVREMHFPTLGPKNRYSAILFIEKEGFLPLFRAVHLAERYDLGIMSTKGMSVTACRELVEALCRRDRGIPLFVLHDFDKSGFSILGTLGRNTRRYTFVIAPNVIDLGMRIDDIAGLQREASNIPRGDDQRSRRTRYKATLNLARNGATPAEIEFLLRERVELNAFTSDALVGWIEGKLDANGVKKVVPDDEMLAAAYRRASEHVAVQRMIDDAVKVLREKLRTVAVPTDLRTELEKRLAADPTRTWDSIVIELAALARP
jgi:hypothetical protein